MDDLYLTAKQIEKIRLGVRNACRYTLWAEEDAYQEVIAKLYYMWHKDQKDKVINIITQSPLLYTFSYHRAIDYLRSMELSNRNPLNSPDYIFLDMIRDPVIATSNSSNPTKYIDNLIYESFENKSVVEIDIGNALNILTPIQRIIIQFKYWDELPIDQMVIELDLKQGFRIGKATIGRVLITAKEILRLYLGENYMNR